MTGKKGRLSNVIQPDQQDIQLSAESILVRTWFYSRRLPFWYTLTFGKT